VPALVLFALLLLAFTGVAAGLLVALPRLEGRLMEDLAPTAVEPES
jgi:hypothetical protein